MLGKGNIVFCLDNLSRKTEIKNTHINIDTSKKVSFKKLAKKIKNFLVLKGNFIYNKFNVTMRKLIDLSMFKYLGRENKVKLLEGLRDCIISLFVKYAI